jgi:hypothetical protein
MRFPARIKNIYGTPNIRRQGAASQQSLAGETSKFVAAVKLEIEQWKAKELSVLAEIETNGSWQLENAKRRWALSD